MGLCTFVVTFGLIVVHFIEFAKELDTFNISLFEFVWLRSIVIAFYVIVILIAFAFLGWVYGWVYNCGSKKKTEKEEEAEK